MVVLAPFVPYIAGALSLGSGLLNRSSADAQRRADRKYQVAQRNADIARQNAQIQQQNYERQRQYNYDKFVVEQQNKYQLKIWNAKKDQFNKDIDYIGKALGQAYADETIRYNQMAEKVIGDNFDSYIKLMESQGYAAASGQTGRRAGMRDKMNRAAYGRGVSRRLGNLQRQSQQTDRNLNRLRLQAENAQNRAYSNVAVGPLPVMAPMAPVSRSLLSPVQYQSPYSSMNAVGIGSSILSAAATGFGFA